MKNYHTNDDGPTKFLLKTTDKNFFTVTCSPLDNDNFHDCTFADQLFFDVKANRFANSSVKDTSLKPVSNIMIQFEDCLIGQVVGGNSKCNYCPKGSFNYKKNDFLCYECPFSINCEGRGNVTTKNSIWSLRLSGFISPNFLECPVFSSCDDTKSTIYEEYQCTAPHVGNLCNECEEGHARSTLQASFCSKCSDDFNKHVSIY